MHVDLEFRGDVCIIRLRGRFATGQDKSYLRDKTNEIKASGLTKILGDFSDVSYIDSTGIGFLIGVYTSIIKNQDGMFVLAGVNHRVREVLELTRLTTIFPTYPDEASALEALKLAVPKADGAVTGGEDSRSVRSV